MPTDGNLTRRIAAPASLLAAVTALALVAAGCSSGHDSAGATSAKTTAVTIDLTPAGCAPKPASVPAGEVSFTVANKDADSVSEAELRTSDLSKILGEQENLTPGLSGGFSLNVQSGSYKINCPGAAQQHWTFTVTGKKTAAAWQSNPQLTAAVSGYSAYINQNTADLVTHTQTFCRAIDAGNMTQAEVLYPQARIYYERIEPVAEIWGSLDTDIDGRWENPVTVASQFIGFHRIEQLMWEDNTLTGAAKLCAGLVKNEQQLLTLVRAAQYNPLEMASGATDLINEAATAKITGEEERYSGIDLIDFRGNLSGAIELVHELTPFLAKNDPSLLNMINARNRVVEAALDRYEANPGYDETGFVNYATVTTEERRNLSEVINGLAEAISAMVVEVST